MSAEPYIPEDKVDLGPSAKVYRAHEVKGNRLVRLKVLLADHDSPYALDRDHLAQRAPLLQAVVHPNICRLIELDVQAQDMAIVSEFAEGLSGWTYARRNRLTSASLRVLAGQLMEALKVAESCLVLHGDVKPANLYIENRPIEGLRLKLQDWGVGQSRHKQPRETSSFRAPELHDGETATLRGDLYSAGATLATLAGMEPGMEGEAYQPPRSREFDKAGWRARCTSLDPALVNWLEDLLQTDPLQRPASASEALDWLHGRKPSNTKRPLWFTLLSMLYNVAVTGTLVAYLLWLNKMLAVEGLRHFWQRFMP